MPRITQKEIANIAGVSQGTVSIVLGNSPLIERIPLKTREQILEIAAKNGYQANAAARQLRSGKSELVAILLPKTFSYYFQDLIFCIEKEFLRLGYHCIIMRFDRNAANAAELLRQVMKFEYAGILCLDHYSFDSDLMSSLLQCNQNIVYLDPPNGVKQSSYVSIDYASGAREAVLYLAGIGKKRIALCINDLNFISMKGRNSGYIEGLAESGFDFNPKLRWVAQDFDMSGADDSNLYNITEHIIKDIIIKEKTDAVILSNDEWAVVLIKALKHRGYRIPEDIAIVGYGDFKSLCWACEPEITSISHGNAEIASALSGLLIKGIAGDDKKARQNRVIVKSYLVPRKSA